jgi:hypothetical protein
VNNNSETMETLIMNIHNYVKTNYNTMNTLLPGLENPSDKHAARRVERLTLSNHENNNYTYTKPCKN